MNESGVWSYLKRGMITSGWHATRIESSSGNGVPDISFGIKGINGWLELKYIKEWPKRATTKVKLPLRPEQKHWIKARGEIAGNVWVLVRIQDDFFLLDWREALLACEGFTRLDWGSYLQIREGWYKHIDFDELYQSLEEGC